LIKQIIMNKYLIPGLALLTGMGCKQARESRPEQPNIIFIFTDDHSFQTLSAYDNRYIETPNLDRIAKDGLLFANSFVSNSISAPSRATLLTGKHSHANGQRTNEDIFDGSQQTFPKLLQENGYQTALIGKWHLQSDPTGFDYWNILPGQGHYYNPDFIKMGDRTRHEGYVTNIITDFSIDWLDHQREPDKPFLLMVHHKAMHRNWMPDTTHLDEFKNVYYPLPETFFDEYEGRRAAAESEMSIHSHMDLVYDLKMADPENEIQTRIGQWYRQNQGEYGRMTPGQRARWDAHYLPIIKDFQAANLTGNELSEWKFQRYMQDYLACTRSLDENVGRLLDHLEQMGVLDNTLVVYTSDQGFYMGEHGWYDKRFMYEESFRTPLIMLPPKGFQRRGRVEELVQNIDHAPTLLDIAGVKVPDDMHGRSLVPLMGRDMTDNWREALYYHYYEFPGEHSVKRHFGIHDGRYKLIRFYFDVDEWEFYDLEKDPHEINNVYGHTDYAGIIEAMKDDLRELMIYYDDQPALEILDGQVYSQVKINIVATGGALVLNMETDLEGADIYFTLDGSEPNLGSQKYSGPFELVRSVHIKAIAGRDGDLLGQMARQPIVHHKASGRNVEYKYPVHPNYTARGSATLTDGIRGGILLRPGWHGFNGTDMVALIDLGEEKTLQSVTVGALQRQVDWVFLPNWIRVEVSDDGKNYHNMGRKETPEVTDILQVVDIKLSLENVNARFLKVTARNFGIIPPGHSGEGNPAWLFVDEIMVE
jgi:arylsulfatase A-like enzyme